MQWQIPVHACNSWRLFINFPYLFYLGRISLLGLQTKTISKRNSSTFCQFKSYNPEIFMSSVATTFVLATLKYSLTNSASHKKWHVFPYDGFPRFKYHSIALVLLYNNIRLERRFSIKWFKLHAVKNSINFCYFTIETLNKIRINQ